MQMGPASLPTPLTPVAITGLSPREASRPALAPASGPVRRQGKRWAPFLPAWRFRGRVIRGGPLLPVPLRPKPSRFLTTLGRISRPTDVVPITSFSRAMHCPKTAACYACFQDARLPPSRRNSPTFLHLFRWLDLKAHSSSRLSIRGWCAPRVSRSRGASRIYPHAPQLAVDKCGKLRQAVLQARRNPAVGRSSPASQQKPSDQRSRFASSFSRSALSLMKPSASFWS